MPTPAYTQLDSNSPDGATSPTTYAAADLANVRALRDMAITGRASGFVQTRTTGTGPDAARPQYITWLNATLSIGFRTKATWGGTGNYNITSMEWEWSNDNGGTWTSMGTAQANTYDAAAGNITASTNSGGFFTIVMEIWSKVLKAVADLAAHIAATGTAVHGLGSIAIMASSAATLTGTSTLDGTGGVGQSTAPPIDATRVRETFHDYGTIAASGTVTLELDKYAHFAFTPDSTTSSTVTIALSGSPASGKSQTWMLEIINGQRSADAKITWPGAFHWLGGSATRPLDTALEVSGRNMFSFTMRDNAIADINHLGKRG